MPGIVGFTAGSDRGADLATLGAMQDLITHHDFYQRDPLASDNGVCATRSHINIGQPGPQPYVGHGLQVWFDGEFYNRDEIQQSLGCEKASDPQLLAELFRENDHDADFHFLRQINGIYSAVVYDAQRRTLYLVTDRYGLRHLYWTALDGRLAWASEYKAFLALPGFQPRIDTRTVPDFLTVGSCLGDLTWFEDVQVLSSGSVLTWDLQRGKGHKVCYWGWDQIRPMTGRINEGEVVEELGRLFRRAVERCYGTGERVGLHLSGGLDSRAILASIPKRDEPLHVFTYGQQGCDDIRLARKAAKLRDTVHHIVEINASNWLTGRSDAVWWLDGQKNLLHMHYVHSLRCSRQFYDTHLSGFLGGNTVGGQYLNYKGQDEIDVIENRGRRLIWGGLRLGWMFDEERPVFFDSDFISFAMSIPKALRKGSYIYNRMLFTHYPDYYRHIAWQTTGCPISWPRRAIKPVARVRWFRFKVLRRLNRYGIRLPDHSQFADYDAWLRREPARSTFMGLLFDREALYPAYADRDAAVRLWQEHQAGADWADQLCRYVTFELWLRQVFQNEFRPTGEDDWCVHRTSGRRRGGNSPVTAKGSPDSPLHVRNLDQPSGATRTRQ